MVVSHCQLRLSIAFCPSSCRYLHTLWREGGGRGHRLHGYGASLSHQVFCVYCLSSPTAGKTFLCLRLQTLLWRLLFGKFLGIILDQHPQKNMYVCCTQIYYQTNLVDWKYHIKGRFCMKYLPFRKVNNLSVILIYDNSNWCIICIFAEHFGKMLCVYKTHLGPHPACHRQALPSSVLHLCWVPQVPWWYSLHSRCFKPNPLHRRLPQVRGQHVSSFQEKCVACDGIFFWD